MTTLRVRLAHCTLLVALILPGAAQAANFCVDSASGLVAAVVTGQFSGQSVEIRVVQGNYNMPGGFNVQYNTDLTISGGWTAGCSTRSLNPALTTFNGQNNSDSGWFIQSSASITIEGLRLFQVHNLHLTLPWHTACTPGATINVRRTMIQYAGNTSTDSGALFIASDCHRTRVINNLISNAAGNGILFQCWGENNSVPPAYQFSHNTVRSVNNLGLIARPRFSSSCGGGLAGHGLYNNIFQSVYISAHAPIIRNNIYNQLTLQDGASLGPGSGENLTVNPQLDANFRPITPGSPAINSGTANVPGGLPGTDIEGTNRVIGTAPDRGAYESNVNDLFLISVTNNNNAGAGSLRAAIEQANASPGLNAIDFNMPGNCPRTISLSTPLPNITSSLIISGFTQSGSTPNSAEHGNNGTLCVSIRRSATAPAADVPRALNVPGGSSATLTVRGIAFGGFSGGGGFVGPSAILLQSASGHRIQGNQFGGLFAGTTLPASSAAVRITAGSTNVLIGGYSPSQRNTISGNTSAGVVISGTAGGHEIINNYIGTNPAGLSAVANRDGILILSSPGNYVLDNLISGNTRDGILISGENAANNLVAGNLIGGRRGGLYFCGIHPLPPCPEPMTNRKGILIDNGANNNLIGAVGSTGSPNRITRSTQHAIRVMSGQGNSILGNSTYNNGTIETDIDLGNFGVNPIGNDCPGESDQANRGQNRPVLQFAQGNGTSGTVSGQLTSCTTSGYVLHRIQFFMSTSCSSSGHGPGETFLGNVFVANPGPTNTQATTQFVAPIASSFLNLPGRYLTATATSWDGNTSEYSACLQIVQADRIFNDRFQQP